MYLVVSGFSTCILNAAHRKRESITTKSWLEFYLFKLVNSLTFSVIACLSAIAIYFGGNTVPGFNNEHNGFKDEFDLASVLILVVIQMVTTGFLHKNVTGLKYPAYAPRSFPMESVAQEEGETQALQQN